MFYYFKGKIVLIESDYVVIDVNNVGYQVLVTRASDFILNEETTIYTYQVVREDEQYLVGFLSLEEKNVFTSLIKVKGLGPKTVIGALSATTPRDVIAAISSNNVAYLKKLPGIGAKAAAQVILDLKGELTPGEKGNPDQYEEVYEALKSLGFKGAAIDRVLATINEPGASSEEVLRIALSKLRTK